MIHAAAHRTRKIGEKVNSQDNGYTIRKCGDDKVGDALKAAEMFLTLCALCVCGADSAE